MKIFDSLSNAVGDTANDIEKNKPLLLTIFGVVGLVATAIEVAYAKPKADAVIKKRHENRVKEESKAEEIGRDILVATPVYLPAIATGAMTIGCMVGSYNESSKRTAAYATAYTLTETKLKDYQAKVIETLGDKKEQKIRNEVAAEKVRKNPPAEEFIINDTDTLFYDTGSGRYFRANIDTVRNAIASLNERLYCEMFVSLNEFYYEIGLPEIKVGDDIGFNVDNGMIRIPLDNWMDYNGHPCLVLEYDYGVRFDWRSLH